MARIFLTGATGFVGRRLRPALTSRGHQVTCLPGRNGDGAGAWPLESTSYTASLAAADVVVHLAASTGKAPPSVHFRTNVDGTRALINSMKAAGAKRIIFASTIAVTFSDKLRYPYAQSKTIAEQLIAESSFDYTIVRPTMIGGPGSPVFTGLTRLASLPVIPAFAGAAARVQPIHVADLSTLLIDLVESNEYNGQVLEFGGREILTLRELLSQIHIQKTGKPPSIVNVPVAPIIPLLAIVERVALSATPLTVGQLATFRFDGVAKPNALWNARVQQFASVAQMLNPAS